MLLKASLWLLLLLLDQRHAFVRGDDAPGMFVDQNGGLQIQTGPSNTVNFVANNLVVNALPAATAGEFIGLANSLAEMGATFAATTTTLSSRLADTKAQLAQTHAKLNVLQPMKKSLCANLGMLRANSASSCAAVFACNSSLPSGAYWVQDTRVLCNNVTRMSMGGDGSSVAAAGISCESIRVLRVATSLPLFTSLFFIGLGTTTGITRAYCALTATNATLISGDGTSALTAAASCMHLNLFFSETTSAVRFINPAAPFQVYCDQSDGGGWMKILQYDAPYYNLTRSAAGNIATPDITTFAKLSDNNINYLKMFSAQRVYRYDSLSPTGLRPYLITAADYNDLLTGQNLLSLFYQGCEGPSFANCSNGNAFRNKTTSYQGLESQDKSLIGDVFLGLFNISNGCDRVFTDYGGTTPNCFNNCSTTCRCFSAGNTCLDSHPVIRPFTMHARPLTVGV
eukprot:m.26427 g.26427  ORF g.26427 m.26427 type:complete len:455 (-) comp8938_c0_seq1:31-1395(-)